MYCKSLKRRYENIDPHSLKKTNRVININNAVKEADKQKDIDPLSKRRALKAIVKTLLFQTDTFYFYDKVIVDDKYVETEVQWKKQLWGNHQFKYEEIEEMRIGNVHCIDERNDKYPVLQIFDSKKNNIGIYPFCSEETAIKLGRAILCLKSKNMSYEAICTNLGVEQIHCFKSKQDALTKLNNYLSEPSLRKDFGKKPVVTENLIKSVESNYSMTYKDISRVKASNTMVTGPDGKEKGYMNLCTIGGKASCGAHVYSFSSMANAEEFCGVLEYLRDY